MTKRNNIFALNKAIHLCLFIFIYLFPVFAIAQNHMIDSLQKELENLKTHPENFLLDTTRVNTLNILSREMINIGSYSKGDSLAHEAMNLAQSILPRNKGVNEYTLKKAIANSIRNIGIVFEEQGNFPKALENFLNSLSMNEKLGYKKGIAGNLISIGIVYKEREDYKKALDYYFKALKIVEEMGNMGWKGISLVNIGNVYEDQHQYGKALEYYFKALVLNERLGNKSGISTNLGNIGIIYKEQGEYTKALEYYFKALKISEDNGNREEIGRHTGNIGALYIQQKKYKEAEEFLNKALKISTEIGDLNVSKEWYMDLSDLYARKQLWQKSLDNYKKYIVARDSIYNGENTVKTLRVQMNFDYEKRATADSVRNAENQKVKDAEILAQKSQLNQEKTQRYSLYGGMLLVLIFSGFLFNRFKVIRQQKTFIEQQKHLVEKKNKEVFDSINYARRIQEALLKEEEHITEYLPPHFVLFKPKDIVSGDFYWSQEKKSLANESKGDIFWYLCVADCTGHGVPGAFMSMLCTAYLNEINASENILSPAEILDKLREKIVKELKQSGETGENKDGMDVSMMRLNLRTMEMQWAGANNPLWISKLVEEKLKLVEVKADKQPIGYTINPKPFTNHHISITKGDTIYLFSDGYADQFGGPKGKKFKQKQLQEKLLSIYHEALSVQKEILNTTFEEWRGGLDQLDDVAMIGVRMYQSQLK
jgi:tetratricopeptide (TPR) repeat protein